MTILEEGAFVIRKILLIMALVAAVPMETTATSINHNELKDLDGISPIIQVIGFSDTKEYREIGDLLRSTTEEALKEEKQFDPDSPVTLIIRIEKIAGCADQSLILVSLRLIEKVIILRNQQAIDTEVFSFQEISHSNSKEDIKKCVAAMLDWFLSEVESVSSPPPNNSTLGASGAENEE